MNLELSARPSSQKYVSDLIDKMIELKNLNERLIRENEKLTNLVVNFEEKYEMVLTSKQESEPENPENKDIMKSSWEKTLIKDTVQKFLSKKKTEKSVQLMPEKSNF